jgi:transcriptional regulator with XRE-family HTH domain
MNTAKVESKAYFRALGKHVTVLRKQRGMTQAELARALGVSQQSVFSYELGDRRTSIFILAKLSKVFDIPIADLIGMSSPSLLPKRRLSPRAAFHAERLQALSRTKKRFVIRIIDLLEEHLGKKPVEVVDVIANRLGPKAIAKTQLRRAA